MKMHQNLNKNVQLLSENTFENLELWDKGQPAGQRVEDKIAWYIEFLTQHGYKVSKD